ncbi:MAG TPA: ATP-dependent helicase C-terminal domain-containing protein, partial [Tepidisphaeraceae bacterium]
APPAPRRDWPVFDDARLGELIAAAAAGKRSLEEVRRAGQGGQGGLAAVLRGALAYPLDRLLDELAPETITVPTGNRIRLTYAAGLPPQPPLPPVLAVRLQEIFGLTETPRVANGRVAVLLHLLAPNYRPVQVTQDLRSFWKTTYFQVRKDLRARYPKHAWPEDPLTAPPQAKHLR